MLNIFDLHFYIIKHKTKMCIVHCAIRVMEQWRKIQPAEAQHQYQGEDTDPITFLREINLLTEEL